MAVSGGVDSVALLDMLATKPEYELVVAHVDHGIRPDSPEDAELVRSISEKYALNIVITKLNLPKKASENQLRQARYDFLYEQMWAHKAAGIITAHHADDLLETSIMNVQRGTDRYGAAGGMTRHNIIRPLINVRKSELVDYARANKLTWHEDSTNTDTKYTRNKIRHQLIPATDLGAYKKHLTSLMELNKKIDSELAGLVFVLGDKIIIKGSASMALREVEVLLAYALRRAQSDIELNSRRIAQLAREIMLGSDKIRYNSSYTVIWSPNADKDNE